MKKDHSKTNINFKGILFLLVVLLITISILFLPSLLIKLKNKYHSNSIIINEYVTSNYNTWRDSDWDSPDWIELYNNGNSSIWLGDIYISDDAELPEKALLPDYTLEPGEYFLVLASDKENTPEDEFHVAFKLGSKDMHISLTRNESPLDILEIETLPTDISKGRTEDGSWAYFATPTPFAANTTQASDSKDIIPVWGKEKSIVISEYMTNNAYTLIDENGDSNDWVELYNTTNSPVNIGSMYLSDKQDVQNKFKLPDYKMQPGEYLIINLTGSKGSEDQFAAPFCLGGNDKHIVLTDQSGYAIDILDVYILPEGVSAGQSLSGTFGFYAKPTPGTENDVDISVTADISPERTPVSNIVINEVMSNNKYGILDSFGMSSDWIELYNPNEYDVSLKGFGLSDDAANPLKWQFPDDAVISAGEYLVIFASGNDEVMDGEYHTNFKLSADDTMLILSEPNAATADRMVMEQLPGNVSKGRKENGEIAYFTAPTPGRINDTHPNDQLALDEDIILQDLYISEVSASKVNLNRDVNVSLIEYIELFNDGEKTIDLSGYSVMDNDGGEFFFENISINPNEYLLIVTKGWVPERYDAQITEDISINGAGETIMLKDDKGIIIDCLCTGYLLGEYSYGRSNEDKYNQIFFSSKTPGQKNSKEEFLSVCSKPEFSQTGGVVSAENVTLTIDAEEGAVIKYTTNGSAPTASSKTYTNPLSISENTVVRALAIREDKLPSSVSSSTFIFDKTHDIPIMCLSTSNYNLFSYDYGIYAVGEGHDTSEFPYYTANYWRDDEREVSIEYYETNGKLALNFNAGLQIFGGFSRALSQKSFVVHIRDEYGLNELYYPFFEDTDANLFKHFLLRSGGQDTQTKLKDYYVSDCAINEGGQDGMCGQPVAVYINGQYWGLYNIREKLNADYIYYHYGIEQDNLNIIAANDVAIHGNSDDWIELKTFCLENDFSIQENYDKLAGWIDIEHFTDYIIFQTFFSNTDSGNIKYWRDNTKTQKWRILFYDVDLTLRNNSYHEQMIRRMFGEPNNFIGFSTHVNRALIQNEGYREYFLERYAYYLNEVFTDEYLIEGIDAIANVMKNEMIYQTQRWPGSGSYDSWVENVEIFKEKAVGRGEIVAGLLQDYLEINEEKMEELFPRYE